MLFEKKIKEAQKKKEADNRFNKALSEISNIESMTKDSLFKRMKDDFTSNKSFVFISILNVIFILDFIIAIYRLVMFIITLEEQYIITNILYIIIFAITPFINWIFATEHETWNYRYVKLSTLAIFICHAMILLLFPLMRFGLYAICPYILDNVVISALFSFDKAIKTCRFAVCTLPLFILLLFAKNIIPTFRNEYFCDAIKAFKLCHIIDLRKNKRYLYDLKLINNIDTGKPIRTYEKDRNTHIVVIGATGTGKTATGFYPAIYSDLNQKVKNDDTRQKELYRLVFEGKAFIDIPPGANPANFKNSYVVPRQGYEKEYNDILAKYKTACIIVVAPDNDLTDGVARLAMARSMNIKYIDPTMEAEPIRYAEFGKYRSGMNPFEVPRYLWNGHMDEEAEFISVVAKNVANNLEAIDQRKGKGGDPFFSSVNRNITTVVATINILYWTHVHHRNATWSDIQRSLDFKEMRTMMKALNEKFGYCINRWADDRDKLKCEGQQHIEGDTLVSLPGSESGCALQYTPWESTFNYVFDEMLDPEQAQKVLQYSYGLRNIINEFLQNPFVKRTFSENDEHTIHLSDAFDDGDIIICNYGLKLGDDTAIACGLAFQLMVNHAMFQRTLPKDRGMNPSPVYEYVDELPVILSPGWIEQIIALGRKYGVSLFCAFQTTAQLMRSETTKYLRDILMGVGTIICFGRASQDEMEILSNLSGLKKVESVQTSSSSTSIMEDNPTLSSSERTTSERKLTMEPQDIRFTDFTEATILASQNGRILQAQHGKMHFLKRNAWQKVKRLNFDWARIAAANPLSEEDKHQLQEIRNNMAAIQEKFNEERRATIGRQFDPLKLNTDESTVEDTTYQKHISKKIPQTEDTPESITIMPEEKSITDLFSQPMEKNESLASPSNENQDPKPSAGENNRAATKTQEDGFSLVEDDDGEDFFL